MIRSLPRAAATVVAGKSSRRRRRTVRAFSASYLEKADVIMDFEKMNWISCPPKRKWETIIALLPVHSNGNSSAAIIASASVCTTNTLYIYIMDTLENENSENQSPGEQTMPK